MKKIGILGGTFNPIHIGHLAIAQTAVEKLGLDHVIFVPANRPPHRTISNLASAKDRYEMVRLSIRGNPLFEVSDFEIKRQGKSYSIDSVNHFKKIYPAGTKLYFIVGADNLPSLNTWRNIEELKKKVTFVVVNRPGHENDIQTIRHISVNMPGMDISASFIRRRIKQEKTIKYLVNDDVFRYIKTHKIYKSF